jgi:hypothetical protein
MNAIRLPLLIPVLMVAASLVSNAGETAGLSLDRVARQEIIVAADQAVRKHVRISPYDRNGDTIGQEYWGEAIARLKPLRVYNDKMNVVIVLKDNETTEEGLYVSVPFSSYAPGQPPRFLVFEKLTQPEDKTFGEIYRCKLAKPRPAATRVKRIAGGRMTCRQGDSQQR